MSAAQHGLQRMRRLQQHCSRGRVPARRHSNTPRGLLFLFLRCFALSLALSSCAVIKPPSGGPEDKTPPSLDSTSGPSQHTNFHDQSIVLKFSEYVDRGKVVDNLMISPEKRMDFSWSGRACSISFPDGLDSNTTYALSLGTEYTDLHGNKPAQAYTTVFSTSSHLDSGAVEGTLVDPTPSGVYVFLYALNGINPDTLDARHTKSRYRTQVGTNGSFAFHALPAGSYRLMAVRSGNKDGLYHAESDAFGTTADTISIKGAQTRTVRLRLSPAVDNTPPQLVEARARNTQRVELQCSEVIDTTSLHPAGFAVRDSGSLQSTAALAAYVSPANAKNIMLLFPKQTPKRSMELKVASDSLGMRDLAGNHVSDSSSVISLSFGPERDSTPPLLLPLPLRDSTVGAPLQPVYDFVWNTALQREGTEAHIGVFRGNQRVPTRLSWVADNIMRLSVADSLESDTWYELRFRTMGLRSFDSLLAPDTTYHLRFKTLDARLMGTLKGVLVDSAHPNEAHIVIIKSKNGLQRQLTMKSTGNFEFRLLPEAEYSIEAYCDLNHDGRYTAGTALPYRLAEPFSVQRSGIAVKARWLVDDIRISIDSGVQ